MGKPVHESAIVTVEGYGVAPAHRRKPNHSGCIEDLRVNGATTISQDTIESKRALICGVTGQDGALLAKLLLDKGYKVWGTSCDAQAANRHNLSTLKIEDRVQLSIMVNHDFRSVLRAVMACCLCEIYFLAGQTSVGLHLNS